MECSECERTDLDSRSAASTTLWLWWMSARIWPRPRGCRWGPTFSPAAPGTSATRNGQITPDDSIDFALRDSWTAWGASWNRPCTHLLSRPGGHPLLRKTCGGEGRGEEAPAKSRI